MKQFKELQRSSKQDIVVSILECNLPSITEELILRTGNKISENKKMQHISLVYKNPITESKLVKTLLNANSNKVLYYTCAEDITKIFSEYNVKNVVCEDTIASRFKNPVTIASQETPIFEHVISGDIEEFKKITPSNFRDIDSVYFFNVLREEYKLGTLVEKIILPKDASRESYFNGLHNVGDIVESKGNIYEVLTRGSNYLVLIDQYGDIQRKWPADVNSSNQTINWDIKDDQLYYKGYSLRSNQNLSEETLEYFKRILEENKDPFLIINTLKLTDIYFETKNESVLEKIESNMNKLLEASNQEKIKAARVIGATLGLTKVDSMTDPTMIINTGLRKIKGHSLQKQTEEIIVKMLEVASSYGIDYDKKLAPASIKEALETSDYKTDKNGKKYPAHKIIFKDEEQVKEAKETVAPVDKTRTDNISQGIVSAEDMKNLINKLQKPMGHSYVKETDDHSMRHRKVRYVHEMNEDEDISDEDMDIMVSEIKGWEDIVDCYEEDEFQIIDEESGEIIECDLQESAINEVLSKIERIRSKIRFAKTQAKRERKIQLALKKRSSTDVINNRARKAAIKAVKLRIAKKPLDKLSVPEKERLERIIAKRKDLIKRLAVKMVPKIRKIETERLERR